MTGYSKAFLYGELDTSASIAAAIGGTLSLDGNSPVWARGERDGSVTMRMKRSAGSSLSICLIPADGSVCTSIPGVEIVTDSSAILPPVTATIDLGCTPNPVQSGGVLTCLTRVSAGATGTISYYLDGSLFAAARPDSAGNSNASAAQQLSSGSHTATAGYGGSIFYPAASAAFDFTVQGAPGSTPPTPSPAGTVLYSYQINEYAPNGNINAYTDSVNGSWTAGYDSLNRIVSASQAKVNNIPSMLSPTNAGQKQNFCWQYDSFGNRTRQAASDQAFDSNCATPGHVFPVDAVYDGNNRITATTGATAYLYDDSGNVVDDGRIEYVYDGQGQMCASRFKVTGAKTGYLYNAEGQRVGKGSLSGFSCDLATNGFALTNEYILGPGGEELTELDGQGNFVRTNVQAGGKLIATYDNNGLHYHLSDWLGTRRVQTSDTGGIEETCTGGAFGDQLNCTGNGATNLHFTESKLFDLKDSMKPLIHILLLLLASANAVTALAQGPQSAASAQGLSPLAVYMHGDADNVNPLNGNVFLSIPLASFPQRGHALDLTFRIYYNSSIWFTIAQSPSDANPYWAYRPPLQQQKDPIGVYVARAKHLTQGYDDSVINSQEQGTGSGRDVHSIVLTDHSLWVRESNGAKHYYGDALREDCIDSQHTNSCPQTYPVQEHYFPSTDLTGFQPANYATAGGYGQPAGIYGPDGILHSWSNLYETQTDSNANTIAASSTGWTDSVGRQIPGSVSLPGYGDNAVGSSVSKEPTPGVTVSPSSTTCPSGTTSARQWSIPGIGNSSQTYYLCYRNFAYQTAFNVPDANGRHFKEASSSYSGSTPALLLASIVLPDSTSYTFDYDNYLSLKTLGLPTGGSIAYDYQNIVFFTPGQSYLTHPLTRVLTTRTVTPNQGGPSQVWRYAFVMEDPSRVVPAWMVVTSPAGEDTEYTYLSNGSGVAESMAVYSGCSPHDPGNACLSTTNRLKKETYAYNANIAGSAADSSTAAEAGATQSGGGYKSGVTVEMNTDGANSQTFSTVTEYVPGNGACTVALLTISNPPVPANTYSHDHCYGYARPTAVSSYDYGIPGSGSSGTLLRKVTTTFKNTDLQVNSSLAGSLLDLVDSTVTSDSNGTDSAKTTFAYDEAGSPQGAHGNLTSTTRWLKTNNAWQATGNLVTTQIYNANGMPETSKDTNGNQTSLEYDSTGTFLSKVTHPQTGDVQHIEHFVFDSTGAILSHTDENNQSTTYSYQQANGTIDPFGRVQTVTFPTTNVGTSTTSYSYADNSGKWTASTERSLDSARTLKTRTVYDGLGRVVCAADIGASTQVETGYDYAGRTAWVTNPHNDNSSCGGYSSSSANLQPAPDPEPTPDPDPPNPGPPTTDPGTGSTQPSVPPSGTSVTYFTYDALGRKTLQTNPDSTAQMWSYTGASVAKRDESMNIWTLASDALGRTIAVTEPDLSLTTYSYNALSDLVCVNQWGRSAVSSGCSGLRSRKFVYDSLSRVLTAKNPETGSVGYAYKTPSGTFCSGDPSLPCRKTDARSMLIDFSYDTQSRLVTKQLSGPDPGKFYGPTSCYSYDSYADATRMNAVGRLTAEWTQKGACSSPGASASSAAITLKNIDEYDAMGRVTKLHTCVFSKCFAGRLQTYNYDLAGNLTGFDDGRSNKNFGLGFDSAGRLDLLQTPVSGSGNPFFLYQVNEFSPFGPSKAVIGSIMTLKTGYDLRGRVTSAVAMQGKP